MKSLVSASALKIACAALAAPLCAHDVWIEPATFSPAPGQTVGVRLRVGQDLMGDPLARNPALVNQFIVETASGRGPVAGIAGADPAGVLRVNAPGLHVIGYRSNASAIELPADKFNQYLKEEGLDRAAAQRARSNQAGSGARELFSRCAKSLVLSGPPRAAEGDRRLGFPLELVAERNPYSMRTGEELAVRLTYENRPLEGALVVAISKLNPERKVAVRSGADGRARFLLRSGGMWLVKAVHMVPARAGSNADWESFWASLTFELP
jgi:hypothetical protein